MEEELTKFKMERYLNVLKALRFTLIMISSKQLHLHTLTKLGRRGLQVHGAGMLESRSIP
jgi:hypothetical protein